MKYCVYAFTDGAGKPYYIGKTGNYTQRYKDHLYAIKTKNMLPKYQRARKLFGKGHKFKMKKLAEAVTEQDAYLIERTFIKEYFKRGYKLTNMTKGGPDEVLLKPKKVQTKVKKKKVRRKKK